MKILYLSSLLIAFNLFIGRSFEDIIDEVIKIKDDRIYVSDECREELKIIKNCATKISPDFENLNNSYENLDDICDPMDSDSNLEKCRTEVTNLIDKGCKALEVDECKDFRNKDTMLNMVKTGKCIAEDDYYTKVLVFELAALQGLYYGLCTKSDAGNRCPIVEYVLNEGLKEAFDKYKTYEEAVEKLDFNHDPDNEVKKVEALVPKEALTALGDTCRDKSCNSVIKHVNDLAMEVKKVYEKLAEIDIKKQFPNLYGLYEKYVGSFANQKCGTIDGGADSGASSTYKLSLSLVIMIIFSTLLLF